MTTAIRQLQLDIEDHLAAIERMFKPSSVKITLIIRNTKLHDADVLLTMDDPEKAIQVVRDKFHIRAEREIERERCLKICDAVEKEYQNECPDGRKGVGSLVGIIKKRIREE